jgi:hypothetical protein
MHEEAARQTSDDSDALSLLELSALYSKSKSGDKGFFDRLRDRVQAENPHFDLSDIDDAFESLEDLQLSKRSGIGRICRR